MTELSIDELLAAADKLVAKIEDDVGTTTITIPHWFKSPGQFTCLQCHTIYKGTLTHTQHELTHRNVGSCPRCIDEKKWWREKKNFELEEVVDANI